LCKSLLDFNNNGRIDVQDIMQPAALCQRWQLLSPERLPGSEVAIFG
jgi:hypothetical protein